MQPATADHFLGEEPRRCGCCHSADTPMGEMVQTIYRTNQEARTAYEAAENAIAQARARGFIMGPAEEELQRAKTALIVLRALQHSVLLPDVDPKATEVKEIGGNLTQQGHDALAQGVRRRQGAAASMAGMAIIVGLLFFSRRELDRWWEASRESAQ